MIAPLENLPETGMRKGPKPLRKAFETEYGLSLIGKSEEVVARTGFKRYKGNVQLIFTSPPYPLNRKKKYGNLQGEVFVEWLAGYATTFRDLLTENGSIVMELGNCWEPGTPTMSTLALESFLAFKKSGSFHLCQQFVCDNPARLPSPAQWVTIERIRLKDSYTNVWWFGKNPKPKADNTRVLKEYSKAMKDLIRTGKYNAGARPSQHKISENGFNKDNKGAIPSNMLSIANTNSSDGYLKYCREHGLEHHPARMPQKLADFFIKFLTDENDIVFDPFGGSNTTGATAEMLKRRWVTIEDNPEYIRGSLGRFEGIPNLRHYEI